MTCRTQCDDTTVVTALADELLAVYDLTVDAAWALAQTLVQASHEHRVRLRAHTMVVPA